MKELQKEQQKKEHREGQKKKADSLSSLAKPKAKAQEEVKKPSKHFYS